MSGLSYFVLDSHVYCNILIRTQIVHWGKLIKAIDYFKGQISKGVGKNAVKKTIDTGIAKNIAFLTSLMCFQGTKPSIAAIVGSMDPAGSKYECEIRVQSSERNEEIIQVGTLILQ